MGSNPVDCKIYQGTTRMRNVPKPQILRLRNRFGEELKVKIWQKVRPEIGLTNKNDDENLTEEEKHNAFTIFCFWSK